MLPSLVFPLGIVAEGRDDLYVSDAFHKAFLEVSMLLFTVSSHAAFLFPFALLFSTSALHVISNFGVLPPLALTVQTADVRTVGDNCGKRHVSSLLQTSNL